MTPRAPCLGPATPRRVRGYLRPRSAARLTIARSSNLPDHLAACQCVHRTESKTPSKLVAEIPALPLFPGVGCDLSDRAILSLAMAITGNPMPSPMSKNKIREAVPAKFTAPGCPQGSLAYGADLGAGYLTSDIEFVAIAGNAWLLTAADGCAGPAHGCSPPTLGNRKPNKGLMHEARTKDIHPHGNI